MRAPVVAERPVDVLLRLEELPGPPGQPRGRRFVGRHLVELGGEDLREPPLGVG